MQPAFSLHKRSILALYMVIAWCLPTLQAQNKFHVLHFNNDNFLPQNSVNNVAFDRHGYTWLCTQFGLVRYDGYRFRNYNTFNTPSIKNNRFTHVSSDAKGNLYAVDARFAVMQVTDTGFRERKDLVADSIGFFRAKFLLAKERLAAKNLLTSDTDPFKKGDPWLTGFFLDDVRFYFTTASKAGYFDGAKLHVHPSGSVVNSFMSSGLLFTLLDDGTFNVYKNERQIASGVQMEGDKVVKEALKNSRKIFSSFTAGTDSNAYIFLDRTLYLIAGDTSGVTATPICDSLDVKNCINIVHNKETGAYYLCSQTEGLYILVPKHFTSLAVPAFPDKININAYYAIIETGKNKILSSYSYLYENEKVKVAPVNVASRFALYRDRNHHLFLQSGTYLYQTDTSFNILRRYPLGAEEELICVKKDEKNTLWAATRDKLGRLEGGTFRYLLRGFARTQIETFTIQNDSLIWIGTRDGLFLYHTATQRLEEVPAFSGDYVRVLQLDDDGTLWIGTYGQGFYRYKKGQAVKFPADKNGYLSIAHCFMEDRNGFFWIPTNRGLFQVKKSDLNHYAEGKSKAIYYQYYDKTSGFATNEFNGGCNPCGIRISDGSFILPSLHGLVKFNPEAVRPLLPSGPVFLDRISADSISYAPSGSFVLKPRFRQLVFEVSSVYYGNPINNNIEYHIAGLDDNWYPLNEDGKITITSLPYGNYQLQLRRLAGFGPEQYVTNSISFSVAPQFFETIGFKLLALLALVLLIWFGFRIRYNVLEKQKLALEKQVMERTAALRQTVQELQESENVLYNTIQQKEKITSILVHDLKSPLRFLTLVSDHIHSQIDKGNRDELKKLTEDMKKSSRRISMFTDEFLAWQLATKEDFTAGNDVINIKMLADDTANFFEDIVKADQNTLQVAVDEEVKLIADERLLRVILRNLVDNANKHTRNGTIELKSRVTAGHIEIIVKDNGSGMNEEQLKSFQDANGHSLGFSLNVSNQLGSKVIRSLMNKLGGTLLAESAPGEGTTITLRFKRQPVPAPTPAHIV